MWPFISSYLNYWFDQELSYVIHDNEEDIWRIIKNNAILMENVKNFYLSSNYFDFLEHSGKLSPIWLKNYMLY